MRHAEHDLLHAEIAAALDDLLERRDQRLAAVQPEALGAGVFDVEEFLEAFGFHQLVEDGALAFAREGDLLVAALDALLDPRLLRGVGDVHELDAERLAIGAAQDGDDLAHRREVEAEHLVEEDAAVEVGFGEAVGARIELLLVLLRLEFERIELGVEVAAHAVGADQHQRVDRIARRLHDVGGGEFDALGLARVAEIFSPIFFSVSAHWPSSAATRSPPSRSGQFGFLPGRRRRALLSDVGAWRPSGSGKSRATRRRPRPGRLS